jgi:Tfp pilus assembly protein PilF
VLVDDPRKPAGKSPSKVGKPMDADLALARARLVRRLRIIAIAAIAVVGLGAGGFYMYQRHAAQQARRAAMEEHLSAARAAIAAKDPKRWTRAAAEATKVLELDAQHAAAIGLAAEAMLADALAYGFDASGKAARARSLLTKARDEGVSGPEIERARALAAGTARAPDTAALEKLAASAPQDLSLALYLGWAHATRGDWETAARSFTLAITAEPLKIPALHGRAQAKLALADLAGASSDFMAILDLNKDHIAAQVGLASALPAAQAQTQEADLLAILQRKDLATGDPRAVLHAWALAADLARRAGRLEPARDRYRKAQALAPKDVSVIAGLTELEIVEGKLDTAVELIEQALQDDPSHVRAQLVAADLAIRQRQLDAAAGKLQALRTRKPPLTPLDQARLALLAGKLLEAQGQDADAVESFVEAAKLAGEIDLTPALTAVTKLSALAEAAAGAREHDRAAALRDRADRLIAGFAENAKQDPQLALALGMTFLQSNDAGKAEPWLRRVVDTRPGDALAHFQLARALALLQRTDDAVEELQLARKLDDRRAEIGIELARIYEASGRRPAAAAVYASMLAAKDPGIEERASAGRFFARAGEPARAGEQGELIFAIDPTHPAGLYLRAEGALAAGKLEEAGRLFRAAVDRDRDPQYLDGQGRAAEAQAAQTGDLKFQELALRAYHAAAAVAPAMLNPQLGQGRIYVGRRDASKAIPPLLMASKIAPDNPEVARLIGLAYKELSEKRVAVEWLARAFRLAPSADTAWQLGQLHAELNAPREAIAALTNATRLAAEQEKQTRQNVPWLTEALYRLGRIHMDSGHERPAKAAWEKYLGRNPRAGAQLEEVRRELATTLQRY